MLYKKIIDRIVRKSILKIGVLIQERQRDIARITLPQFGNSPRNLTIDLPRDIVNPDRIFLGNDVCLGPGSLLIALTSYPGSSMRDPNRNKQTTQSFNSKIVIGDRVTSTAGLQIAAHSEIFIEDDTLLASNINITDGLHGYVNADEPYKYQSIFQIAPIVIKRGSWIGQNVVIMPGVTIGELSIVGANSVVTKSVPDKCIAIGSPARVIKRWEESTYRWVSDSKVNVSEAIPK
jgi:acetyltransferase-like isoleucine patch superfamily enzyme